MALSVEEARCLYTGADSVHDFDHILRVLALAERIGRAEGADLEIVRTATLLHDWGRSEADAAGQDHAALAARRAREFLAARGEPPVWIEAVVHAIAAHRFRVAPDPATLEAQVLFDADKLDAIGAIGIARAFAYGGAHRQRLWAPPDEVDLARWEANGDDAAHTPVHEFVVKLARIQERLYTREGRAIARDRHHYMEAFYERLTAEVQGLC
ncbi:MAG TPA: HD domain-containing protein [Anaerolineae bacterium]|nr:HD domain-containing protein [Anaerolineae bacterium]HQK13520.1 HD domain-containing protein [Anaerolineae bacterium]